MVFILWKPPARAHRLARWRHGHHDPGLPVSEADYRGKRFRDWKGKDLKGSLELLNLTQPQVVEEIHAAYLDADADIIETNTFSGTTIGLHDFLFPG